MKCKKCGEELEKGAKICPKCGKKVKSIGNIILKMLLIIFLVNIGIIIFGNIIETIQVSKMTPEQKLEYENKKKIEREEKLKIQAKEDFEYICETDNSYYVYEIIKDYVKQNLKSPKTADFPGKTSVKIVKVKDVYTIYGYVDSQNGFGATVRTDYTAAVQQIAKPNEKDSFVIKYCDFN